MKLFNAIAQQEKYDEQAICTTFKNENFIKHLAEGKKRLYQLIAKNLESFHYSTDTELKRFIHQAEIFYHKRLYKPCANILAKAKHIAYQQEKYLQLIEIIEWEQELEAAAHADLQKSKNDKKDIMKEKEVVLEKFVNEQKYKGIRYTLLKHHRLNDIARSEQEVKAYQKIINNDLCSREDKALSFNAKYDFYYIHSVFSYATGDLTGNYRYQKKLTDLFNKHPEQCLEQPKKYISSLANYSYICYLVKKHGECWTLIKKIREFPTRSIQIQILIFRTSYERELGLYLRTGEYHKGIQLIEAIEKGMQRYKDKIPNSYIVTFYFNMASIYFSMQDYSNSLVWLNKMINNAALKNSRADLHCFAHIINLIVHFELGNLDLLEYIVKSTYRFLYKRNRLYKLESCILNFIRKKVPQIITNAKQVIAFHELKTELEEITRDPFEKKALEYFDFISWVESKIEDRPFAEIVQEKAGKG